MWNVILHKEVEDNKVVNPENNPTESGNYLCTCIRMLDGKEYGRYLQIMRYDKKVNDWFDTNWSHGISHNIIAWTDKIKPCDFQDYRYLGGGIFVSK